MLGPFCREIAPFSENVYFMAVVVDPVFACHWMDIDVVGNDEIQTSQAHSSTRQMVEELVVEEAKRTNRIRSGDILIEPSAGTTSSSTDIQSSSSSEDDSCLSANNVAVTYALSTAKVPYLLQKYNRPLPDAPETARKQYRTQDILSWVGTGN